MVAAKMHAAESDDSEFEVLRKSLKKPPAKFKLAVWEHVGFHPETNALLCKLCLTEVSSKAN